MNMGSTAKLHTMSLRRAAVYLQAKALFPSNDEGRMMYLYLEGYRYTMFDKPCLENMRSHRPFNYILVR